MYFDSQTEMPINAINNTKNNLNSIKMKTVQINIYSFNELSEQAKQKAIDEHRNFILSTMSVSDFISGNDEHDTDESLNSAFNAEYRYIYENDSPVIENIEANDYLFFSDGNIANCTTYYGKHPKAGITELKIGNDVYTL